MCAAPIVLEKAGICEGRTLTSYPSDTYRALFSSAQYSEDIVVIDDHLITSRGPATTLPFAFALVDALGGNSQFVKDKMLYHLVYKD